MSTLFDTDGPVELVPADLVRALEPFGYTAARVNRWTRQKAETVLAAARRREARDLNHGAAAAAGQEERDPRALTGRELVARVDAAVYLEQARATGDTNELLVALTHAVYPLTGPELTDLAGAVIVQLRIDPLTLEPIPFGPVAAPPVSQEQTS